MNPPYRACVCGRRAECRKQKPAGQKDTHTLSSLPETTVKHKLKNWKIRPHFVRRECQVPQRAFCLAVWYNLRQHRTIPALRLKHRSGSCGTASALPKCSIRHPREAAEMIRHILFWKYTDAVKAQHQEAEALKFLQNSVATMRGRIDGLLCIEIGLNLAGGDYDLIFYAELRDEQALQCFQQHPLHAAHRERCKDLVTARLCGDVRVGTN
ncbi:MAG: Dabb family protein [Oscillospiraceae bacterium]|nr:Dabb family protein [Oscillospiraceae bacterium]